jgi:hypothetical protein
MVKQTIQIFGRVKPSRSKAGVARSDIDADIYFTCIGVEYIKG